MEGQLGQLQKDISQLANQMKAKFGVDPQTSEPTEVDPGSQVLMSQDEDCNVAGQDSESSIIARLTGQIASIKADLSELQKMQDQHKQTVDQLQLERKETENKYSVADQLEKLAQQFYQKQLEANLQLRTLCESETEKLILRGQDTDFEAIEAKVQQIFQNTNVAGELAFLRNLRELFVERHSDTLDSDAKQRHISEVNEKIDELVSFEAEKQEKVKMIGCLIKESLHAQECQLCKQGLS